MKFRFDISILVILELLELYSIVQNYLRNEEETSEHNYKKTNVITLLTIYGRYIFISFNKNFLFLFSTKVV